MILLSISKYIRKGLSTEEAWHRSFIIVCLFLLVLPPKNSRLGILPENSGFSYFQEIMWIPFSSWEFDTQMNFLKHFFLAGSHAGSLGGELWLDKHTSFRPYHPEFHSNLPCVVAKSMHIIKHPKAYTIGGTSPILEAYPSACLNPTVSWLHECPDTGNVHG